MKKVLSNLVPLICIIFLDILIIEDRGELSEYKRQNLVKDSLINECYATYKYFVFQHSGVLISNERTVEQKEAFDLLDASIDKLLFTTEEK